MGRYSRLPELSGEDRILASHIQDMTEICGKSRKPRFSAFLDERQIIIAKSVLNSLHWDGYRFFGGYEEASRRVLGVFPDYYEAGQEREEFPITALTFRYRESDRLTHRDFLGAFMSRQIKREMVGDIIVSGGKTTAFVYDTVSPMLISEIDKIGSVGVKVSEEDEPELNISQSFIEKNGTVSSLRLDSIVAMAAGISRGKAVSLIKGGNVSVMYVAQESPSFILSEGDVFSVRGTGKFLLFSVNGNTKKDRIHITIKKYN